MKFKQSDNWHFGDSGNRFDGKRPKQQRRADLKPLAPALKRGVVRCKRCGTRVVSGIEHCPFCGQALQPFFMRLWFWLMIVVLLGAGVTYLLIGVLPQNFESIERNYSSDLHSVGTVDDTIHTDLPLGTVVTSGLVEASVVKTAEGPKTAAGDATIALHVKIVNKSQASVTIYPTQWRIEDASGTEINFYLGPAKDGSPIESDFESYELKPKATLDGVLHFATSNPKLAIYQPNALDFRDETLVSWRLS